MFVVNDDLSIYATRGDIVCLNVSALDDSTGNPYEFQPGDIVRMKIFAKKDAENVVMSKDFPVVAKTDSVGVFLSEQDTKIGDVISKPTDYWYEIELNPYTNPQTIVGYDEDGAKIFKLFPEGKDMVDEPVTPEDIPVVDTDLDLTSSRPVENKAIARAVTLLKNDLETVDKRLTGKIKETEKSGKELTERFNNLIAMDKPSLSQNLDYLEVITDSTKAKIDGRIESDGVFANIKVNLREANLIYGGTTLDLFVIPVDCRPMYLGLIHTEDGLEYSINHNTNGYYMSIRAQDSVTVAPSGAGSVTMSYSLYDYELKDVRVGADGVIYPTAGEAVRGQFGGLFGEVTDMFTVTQSLNLFDINRVTQGRLNVSTGQVDPWDSNFVSDFIEITGSRIIPCVFNEVQGTSNIIYERVAQYDANKNFIQSTYGGTAVVDKLPNAKYVRICFSTTMRNYMVFINDDGEIPNEYIQYEYTKKIKSDYLPSVQVESATSFAGKKMFTLGDSIVAHDMWQPYVLEQLGLSSYQNCGISGTMISGQAGTTAFYKDERVNAIDLDSDFGVIMGGTNDAYGGREIGVISQTNVEGYTVVGALNLLISKLYYKWRLSEGYYDGVDYSSLTRSTEPKNVPIYLVTPIQSTTINADAVAEAMVEVGKLWGIPVIDARTKCFLNKITMGNALYSSDGTHPNTLGGKHLGRCVVNGLIEHQPYFE